MLAFEKLYQRCRRESIADIYSDIGYDPFQQIYITDIVASDDILELYGVEKISEILSRRLFFIAYIGKVWHAAAEKIFLKALRHRCFRCCLMVKFREFRERKRIYDKFHIAPAQIRGEFTRKKSGVRSGDVYVAVHGYTERVDTLFPSVDLLYFVEE